MKIGIDISMLVYRGSGVSTYTYNLVKNLLAVDKKNTYHLFYSSFRRPHHFFYLDELKELGGIIKDYPFPPRFLTLFWNTYHLFPVEWFIGKVDIYHSSDFLRPPLLPHTKSITTIHDLTWKIYPQFHTQDIINAHKKKLELTIKNNDVIITDSEKTKLDLLKYYPGIRNLIHIIPLGVDDRYFFKHSNHDISMTIDKYNIDSPYILYVGAIEPRKNLPTLIRAFHEVSNKFPDLKLVLAGRAGWKNDEVFRIMEQLNLKNKTIFTGYVDEDDLPLLYQGAKVFVYPSLYEGFGLPPLEAIASGTPTIAYNSPSLSNNFIEEIDPKDLSTKIIALLHKPQISKITIPSWRNASIQTLSLYQKVIQA